MTSLEIDRYKNCLLRHQQGYGQNSPWGSPVFRGRRGQRGFGIGARGILSKFLLPAVKHIGKKLLSKAVEGGTDILIHKKDPKKVLKEKSKELLGETISDVKKQLGRGKRRGLKRKASHYNLLEEYGDPKRSR